MKKQKIKNKNIRRKSLTALVLSVFLVVIFAVMQGLEIKSATDTEQVTLSTTVAQTISIDVDSATKSLGTLTPGTPVSAATTCTVTSNAESGYDLKVKRDDADTTMDKTDEATTNITDKTAWDPTANAGAGNAATWSGTGLGFGVYASTATKSATWWGTGAACHDVNNKYAGFPDAYALIMDHDTYSDVSTTIGVCYRLDVPSTQKSGSYNGTVTYQAVSKP